MGMANYRVLLVDDDAISLEIAQAALEASGCVVACCSSPFHFASALERFEPDVALVDVLMPALDGDILVEVAKRNRSKAAQRCRLVLHSSLSEKDLQTLAERCGADGCLTKDDPWELNQRLAALMSQDRRICRSSKPTRHVNDAGEDNDHG